MNILSYIIPNVLIALILVCGVINGQKRGWKKSLIKLSYTLVLAVGSFFLNACVVLPAISGVQTIGVLAALFSTLCWMAEFGILMGIAQIIFTIVCHKLDKEARANKRQMKAVKKADVTRKTKEARHQERVDARKHKKEQRLHRKEEMRAWRKAHKTSRAFGAIIGFVGALALSVMMMLTVHNTAFAVGVLVDDINVKDTIVSFYDHSIVGIVDNAISKDAELNLAEQVYIYELASADVTLGE